MILSEVWTMGISLKARRRSCQDFPTRIRNGFGLTRSSDRGSSAQPGCRPEYDSLCGLLIVCSSQVLEAKAQIASFEFIRFCGSCVPSQVPSASAYGEAMVGLYSLLAFHINSNNLMIIQRSPYKHYFLLLENYIYFSSFR